MIASPKTWYVYIYAYPDGTVFYVGKGTGIRIDEHEDEARLGCGCGKCKVIREIWSDGGEVQKSIVLDGLDEEVAALEHERELILKYAGPMLTNIILNTHKKERKIDKQLIRDHVFAETIIGGVAYVSVEQFSLAFSLRKQRLETYLNYLDVVKHRFPFDRRNYVFSYEVERIKTFIAGLQ